MRPDHARERQHDEHGGERLGDGAGDGDTRHIHAQPHDEEEIQHHIYDP